MSRSNKAKAKAKPKLTPEQRGAINAANGSRNHGTDDPDLKRKVSGNALKSGLYAKNIEVLIPDAQEREARRAVWVEKFKPEGPDEENLVEEAVIAEYKLAVADQAHQHILAIQLKRHHDQWEDAQLDRRDDLVKRLETADAPKVLRELGTFAAGAEWVRDSWRDLAVALGAAGRWEYVEQVDLMVRLSGFDPRALVRSAVEGFIRFMTAWSCLDDDAWLANRAMRKSIVDQMPPVWGSASWSINPAKSGRTGEQVAGAGSPGWVEAELPWWFQSATPAEGVEGPEPDPSTLPWWLKGDTPEERAMKRAKADAEDAARLRQAQAWAREDRGEVEVVVPLINAVQKVDTAEALERTSAMVAAELAKWEAKLASARESDAREKACAEARARVLEDTPSNRSLIRQTSVASTALNRAITGLQKASKARALEAEKVERANRAKERRQPPLDAEPGKSYVNIDDNIYRADPIGGGIFQITPVQRRGPGVICHRGYICDPVETDPDGGV